LEEIIMVQCSVGPVITLHGRITARDRLDNQAHPVIQTLFPNNDAVFQKQCPISHSWFKEHEGKIQHLPWPAPSPDLNILTPWNYSEQFWTLQ
jgi:hypothetical protein